MKPITRRQFLKNSCVGAALPIVGGLVVPIMSRATAASEQVRVGLIGCGGMGKGDLATFFLNPEVVCPVVCDVDDRKTAEAVQLVEKRGKTPDVVKDFRRVLERKDVDVLLVATPDHWHALPTVLGCEAGKDVYVEKPLATSIAEGRAMLDAAQDRQRIVQMGAHRRSSPT
jgi:predicted dehydrogenase